MRWYDPLTQDALRKRVRELEEYIGLCQQGERFESGNEVEKERQQRASGEDTPLKEGE
jgi:hypothetical protein